MVSKFSWRGNFFLCSISFSVEHRMRAVKTYKSSYTDTACLDIIGTWMLSHALKYYIIYIPSLKKDSDHLPLCQNPSLKRIYTKAHSLNLHPLDLHPESRSMAIKRGEERQRGDSSERTAHDKHTEPRRLKMKWGKAIVTTRWIFLLIGQVWGLLVLFSLFDSKHKSKSSVQACDWCHLQFYRLWWGEKW